MEWFWYILLPLLGIAVGVIAAAVIFAKLKKDAVEKIKSADEEATRLYNEAIKAGESKKREMLLEAKEEIHKTRTENEKEIKERRTELNKQERRLQQKEESLDKKLDNFERKEEELRKRQQAVAATQEEVNLIKKSQLEMLEKISGLTQEEAKVLIIKNVEQEARHACNYYADGEFIGQCGKEDKEYHGNGNASHKHIPQRHAAEQLDLYFGFTRYQSCHERFTSAAYASLSSVSVLSS